MNPSALESDFGDKRLVSSVFSFSQRRLLKFDVRMSCDGTTSFDKEERPAHKILMIATSGSGWECVYWLVAMKAERILKHAK